MAYFEMDVSTLSRLDFKVLRDGGITAYHAESVLAEDLQWFEQQGYDIREFDGLAWPDESDFHGDIARALEFPSWYGQNLDAFNDCMRDVDIPSAGGMVLVIRNADAGHLDCDWFRIALDILTSIVRLKLLFGRRFIVLLHSDSPGFVLPRIGGFDVQWNPREWLDSSRGL